MFVEDDTIEPAEGEEFRPEADEYYSPDAFDRYLTASILLNRGGESLRGVVKARAKDEHGNPKGVSHSNPLLDTREYEVEFPDGSIDVLTANAIAENLYSQVDEHGRTFLAMRSILDHRKDGTAVAADDSFIPGTNKRRRTTKGWQLLIEWMDGTQDWIPLSEVKESFPVQVAEYAVNNKISSEAAFAWWVPYVLKKRDRIIKKVKSRYWKRTHKFGIEVPRTVNEAYEIDARTGTDMWSRAIDKEMRNVRIALDPRDKAPVGYKEIKVQIVFDIKSDTLARKARLVARGDLTDTPKESTYN